MKILWLTDTHLMPFKRRKLLQFILENNSDALFLTGDISNYGLTLIDDLSFLAKNYSKPIYFICGNHDIWFSTFDDKFKEVSNICKKYSNLIWLTEQNSINLSKNIGLIGAEGFYSADVGNHHFIKCTFDWFLIRDLVEISYWKNVLLKFKSLALENSQLICEKLLNNIDRYDTIYLLTHYPPWEETDQRSNFFKELIRIFWQPYNTNIPLGKELIDIMKNYPNKKLVVLSGHVHASRNVYISHNINCIVGMNGISKKYLKEKILYV